MKSRRAATKKPRATRVLLSSAGGRGVRGLELKGSPAAKCRKMLETLNAYVDGTLDPSVCEHFQKHLAGCNPCQIVIDNVRQTITLYKAGKPYEIPLRCRERLRAMLRARWKSCFG